MRSRAFLVTVRVKEVRYHRPLQAPLGEERPVRVGE